MSIKKWLAGLATIFIVLPTSAGTIDLDSFQAQSYLMASGAPGYSPLDILTPVDEYTGVGDMLITQGTAGTFRCTGSRIGPTQILTAAHCLTAGSNAITATVGTIEFETPSGTEVHAIDTFSVHPDYTGLVIDGNDIAMVNLATTPSADVETYDLYTGTDLFDNEFTKVGVGTSGVGSTGITIPGGDKRDGENIWDTDADLFCAILGCVANATDSILMGDFDSGLAANDAFGFFFDVQGIGVMPGISDLGVGPNEVGSAPGDSGGASFIDGMIAGVTSWGTTLSFVGGATSDVSPGTNSSFGEFFGDVWVGADSNLTYISDFISSTSNPVPGPGGIVIFLLGIAGILARRQS